MAFSPALIVVDMQNDFCPPDGSLAVKGGRDIIAPINQLLRSSEFKYKVGTQDWHPANHISFASNHGPDYKPFESFVEMKNHVANKPHETMQQRLWPVHCVQGTKGAEFVDELDSGKFDLVIRKGMDERVEMYSAFSDCFGNMTAGYGGVSHDLAKILKERQITHAYVVGLAGEYCVKETAIGAAKAGFTTYVIEEALRCTNSTPGGWPQSKKDMEGISIKVVNMDSEEVKKVLV